MIDGIHAELVLAYFLATKTYEKYNHPTCEILLSGPEQLVLSDPGRATGDMIIRDLGRKLSSLGYFSLKRLADGLSIKHLGPNVEVADKAPVDTES